MSETKTQDTISFTGCIHLDFSDNYKAKKNLINLGETKVCWDRPHIYEAEPRLVQFCKFRGRLNSPEACHNFETKMCYKYEEFKHHVSLDTIDK